MGTYFSDWNMEDVEKYNARIKKMTSKSEKNIKDDKLFEEKRKTKYGANKALYDGIKFDSKKEAKRYSELKILEKSNKIKSLKLQVPFELQPKFKFMGKTIRAINYVADFVYEDEKGNMIVEDSKGFRTPIYKLKKKMFEYKYKIEIKEV